MLSLSYELYEGNELVHTIRFPPELPRLYLSATQRMLLESAVKSPAPFPRKHKLSQLSLLNSDLCYTAVLILILAITRLLLMPYAHGETVTSPDMVNRRHRVVTSQKTYAQPSLRGHMMQVYTR